MRFLVTDLRVVVVLGMAATFALLVPGVPWHAEWLFGFLLLLLLPGYAAVAALFPTRPGASANGASSPDWPARFGLSLVGSGIIVAGTGVLIGRLGFVQLTLAPVVLSIIAVTLLAVGIAAVRRMPLQWDRRADPVRIVSSNSVIGGFGTSRGQSVVLVLSMVVLVTTLALAGTSPAEDPYSEVYLSDGEDVDIGPSNGTKSMVAGADNTVLLTIGNHEGDPSDYRVVIRLQRVAGDGTVLAVDQLDDFRVRVASGVSGVFERLLVPEMTGDRLRFQVLVFKGGTNGDIDADSADLALRLFVNVTNGGSM